MYSDNRGQYLKLMGIDVYLPKHQSSLVDVKKNRNELPQSEITLADSDQSALSHTETKPQVKSDTIVSEEVTTSSSDVKEASGNSAQTVGSDDRKSAGLVWLAEASASKLTVILPAGQSNLEAQARQLAVKMIQAIGVKAAECSYVSTSDDSGETMLNFEDTRGFLVFGKSAGDHLVLQCGARRVPGENYFEFLGKPAVVTLHPDELIDTPVLKRQAWNDLKQLDRLMHEYSNRTE